MSYRDPHDVGNSPAYHTGKPCIEPGCGRPAGTAWSPLRCFEHNVERIDRINHQLNQIVADARKKALGPEKGELLGAIREWSEADHAYLDTRSTDELADRLARLVVAENRLRAIAKEDQA